MKQCTSEPKLSATQFKIIHDITNCKSNLYKWKITENDLCDFCLTSTKDDVLHSLGECYSTKCFLTNVFTLLDPQDLFSKAMAIGDFVLGVTKPSPEFNIFSYKEVYIICKKL